MQILKNLALLAAIAVGVQAGNPAQQQQQQQEQSSSSSSSSQGLTLSAPARAVPVPKNAPIVHLKNGPYYGVYNSHYHQDLFLGMRYAQPPVGDLRFRNPLPLKAKWKQPKNATEYSASCYGYGAGAGPMSEDCLTVNVVRPRGYSEGAKLPVVVWIHGGFYTYGGSSGDATNSSYILKEGVDMGKPFIYVSLNYRLNAFGFLWGSTVKEAGVANLGIKDQRMALTWVHENIAKFGGDPAKVTLFGESAGGGSVGTQLLAYGGRDDKLFRAVIIDSKDICPPTPLYQTVEKWDPVYKNLTTLAGCADEKDTLACLRKVPIEKLSPVIAKIVANKATFAPVIDGDFVKKAGALQMAKGEFVHVPVLHGQNEDEGTAYGTKGINTENEFLALIKKDGRNDEQAKIMSILYPDIPEIGIPASLHGRPTDPALGVMYKRAMAYGGDVMQHAGRRYMSQTWAKNNLTIYAYKWNVYVNGIPAIYGATHYQEVAFVYYNLASSEFKDMPKSYQKLAKIMSRSWISFIVDQTPNHNGATDLEWPQYTKQDAQIMVFNTNDTKLAHIAPDTYRAEAIQYIHDLYN